MSSTTRLDEALPNGSLNTPSYPSNCLAFLNSPPTVENSQTAHVRLNIIIVGAGLGGLATAIALATTGHTVTIYEQAAELGEVGAGIQIPSNSTRLLSRLGLDPYLEKYVTEPETISFRRWESGDVIGLTKLIPNFRETFGAPYYVIHRANFHTALHKRALDLGVKIKLAARVVKYDAVGGSITLADGSSASADLIIAADGVKSIARSLVDESDQPQFERTGFAAYRATVDVAKMKADPEISWLLDRPNLNIWIGDQRHVMTYTIGAGKSFNMVLSHPDNTDPSTWDQTTALSDMKREFQGWDSRLLKIISMIESTIKWPLVSGTPLSRWTTGRLVILGDAAHAMLPYMSQGKPPPSLNLFITSLTSYLRRRNGRRRRPRPLPRSDEDNSLYKPTPRPPNLRKNGPVQRARDRAMRPEVLGELVAHSPNQWTDPATQMWAYGYDAEGEIDQVWGEVEGVVKSHL
ncbi:salicylate hydroxylase [Penicillium brasilianum]|uniref:Salicylate hydroxylase n=1 Tax=Penicillium brasilianum TaxID=104259 RepID=A0A1S9RL93_PENBI|nr:salicylate hydroxylase [Penicillium brasilianum]